MWAASSSATKEPRSEDVWGSETVQVRAKEGNKMMPGDQPGATRALPFPQHSLPLTTKRMGAKLVIHKCMSLARNSHIYISHCC